MAAPKKPHRNHISSLLDQLGFDEYEGEEEVQFNFSCPYCHEQYNISTLCAHIEDEHNFESKIVACPICTLKVQQDLVNHITAQHDHLFWMQRGPRLRKIVNPEKRELQETYLKVLLRGSGIRTNSSTDSSSSNARAVTDSLLSSLFPKLSHSTEAEEPAKLSLSTLQDFSFKKAAPTRSLKFCIDSCLSKEERERRQRRATVRASFVQYLLFSSLFGE